MANETPEQANQATDSVEITALERSQFPQRNEISFPSREASEFQYAGGLLNVGNIWSHSVWTASPGAKVQLRGGSVTATTSSSIVLGGESCWLVIRDSLFNNIQNLCLVPRIAPAGWSLSGRGNGPIVFDLKEGNEGIQGDLSLGLVTATGASINIANVGGTGEIAFSSVLWGEEVQ
tara:strand:- start:5043 stop:5573 length:531 start_codon:yes stop_codon:yes gene_type:complete